MLKNICPAINLGKCPTYYTIVYFDQFLNHKMVNIPVSHSKQRLDSVISPTQAEESHTLLPETKIMSLCPFLNYVQTTKQFAKKLHNNKLLGLKQTETSTCCALF